MTQQLNDFPGKPGKQKNFAQINGACKMAPLSDGLAAKACEGCGTVSKLRECPFCGTRRGKKC